MDVFNNIRRFMLSLLGNCHIEFRSTQNVEEGGKIELFTGILVPRGG